MKPKYLPLYLDYSVVKWKSIVDLVVIFNEVKSTVLITAKILLSERKNRERLLECLYSL